MKTPQQLVQKLRKPPAVHNWTRNIRVRRDDLALSLYRTVVFGPKHTLRPVTDVITHMVVDGIDEDTAFKCVMRIKNNRTRQYGLEIISAIAPYIKDKKLKGIQIFKDMVEFYRVAADVNVPVKPTFVINDDGKIIPYFVICWTIIGLNEYQKRILSTLIYETILSLEDFSNSNAVILCIPRHKFSRSERFVVEWKISDYSLLNASEKRDLFDRYGKALADAEQMIFENLG